MGRSGKRGEGMGGRREERRRGGGGRRCIYGELNWTGMLYASRCGSVLDVHGALVSTQALFSLGYKRACAH